MCGTCGCPTTESVGAQHAQGHEHTHVLEDGTVIRHADHHAHAGAVEARRVKVEREILEGNLGTAARNRRLFEDAGALVVNVMASPGAGKTTLLARIVKDLTARHPVAVIEGDQQTSLDADRIRAAGGEAVQINTGKACHLDARMVGGALSEIPLRRGMVLFVENVGNLVCPAAFDLGEAKRVVLASVTEGDDKPLKYPDMFATADLVVLSKEDLLPYVEFDVQAFARNVTRVAPRAELLGLSSRSGEGLDRFLRWIEDTRARFLASPRPAELHA